MGWRPLAALATALIVSTSAYAFVLNDPVIRRPAGEYTINTQIFHSTLGAVSPSGTSWNAGFVEALNAWNDVTALGALIDLGANIGAFEDPCEVADDGIHGVGFSPTFCGVAWGGTTLAIAVRTFSSGGLVTDGNIVFRDDVSTHWNIVAGAQGTFDDFRRVAVHEIGHLLGLDHPPGSNAIMSASVQDSVEVPQADDIAGVVALYDLSCPTVIPVGSGTINGSIDATDCLDTELGLVLPGGVGNCTQIGFDADSFVDLYQVNLPSGIPLDVTLSSSDFNPTIQVFDAVLSSELGCDWGNTSSSASLILLTPGSYVIAARSVFAGRGGDYTLSILPEPSGGAAAAAALLALGALRRRR